MTISAFAIPPARSLHTSHRASMGVNDLAAAVLDKALRIKHLTTLSKIELHYNHIQTEQEETRQPKVSLSMPSAAFLHTVLEVGQSWPADKVGVHVWEEVKDTKEMQTQIKNIEETIWPSEAILTHVITSIRSTIREKPSTIQSLHPSYSLPNTLNSSDYRPSSAPA